MGTSSYAWLTTLKVGLLSIGGILALIAIIMAVVRYFLYDTKFHGGSDSFTSRISHIFASLAIVAFIAGSGTIIADAFMHNATSQSISAGSGLSVVPKGIGNAYSSGKNLGQLLEETSKGVRSAEIKQQYGLTTDNVVNIDDGGNIVVNQEELNKLSADEYNKEIELADNNAWAYTSQTFVDPYALATFCGYWASYSYWDNNNDGKYDMSKIAQAHKDGWMLSFKG